MAATSAARAADDDEVPVVAPVTSPAGATVVAPIATPDVAPARETDEHWYGWQVLAADAAGILGTAACVSFSNADAASSLTSSPRPPFT